MYDVLIPSDDSSCYPPCSRQLIGGGRVVEEMEEVEIVVVEEVMVEVEEMEEVEGVVEEVEGRW